jgi:adenylate cyclase
MIVTKLGTKLTSITALTIIVIHFIAYLITKDSSLGSSGIILISMILTLISLTIVIAIFTKKRIVSPIFRMAQASQQMEKGIQHWVGMAYLSKSISMHRNDEIGNLASSFNHMVKVLGEKEKIRSILGKVVSDEIAKKMLNTKIKLEGENVNATILFLDIRNFTHLSESMQPIDVLSLLNISFTKITNIIEKHHGVVDKYIGDAVMALYGAPIASDKHSHDAVMAALDIVDSLEDINISLKGKGLPEINLGIGINTGKIVAGNIGSENRMNYTAIGDTVNIASRIQDLNKQYKTHIIVGEQTKINTPEINYRSIDKVQVKGKDKFIEIYEPTGIK